MPENDTCRDSIESYGIDVALTELNIAIVNAFENASLAVVRESDVDSTCLTIVDWIICIYRFPPCLETNYQLILPCIEACEAILSFFVTCYGAIERHIHDMTVRSFFADYRCRAPESYYDGYDRHHFDTNQTQSNDCVNVPYG